MDTHNLEQQEYNDRIKLYSSRLSLQWNNVQNPAASSYNGKIIKVFIEEYILIICIVCRFTQRCSTPRGCIVE